MKPDGSDTDNRHNNNLGIALPRESQLDLSHTRLWILLGDFSFILRRSSGMTDVLMYWKGDDAIDCVLDVLPT